MELLLVGPHVGRIGRDVDRQVAEHLESARRGACPDGPPLMFEEEEHGAPAVDLVGEVGAGRCERIGVTGTQR